MGTITGFTAARMQEIEDNTIVGADIVGGHLILARHDGGTVDVGQVQGAQGIQGIQGNPGTPATFGGYVEPINNLGNVSGAVALNFATHNVWRMNPTDPVTISFTNLPAVGQTAPGTLIVANSTYPITWPGGTKFPDGVAPILSGLTFLTLLAESTTMHVGTAWTAVV